MVGTESIAAVVVNKSGKLRFTYTNPFHPIKEPYESIGITTDSHSRTLTTDYNNYDIHPYLGSEWKFLC